MNCGECNCVLRHIKTRSYSHWAGGCFERVLYKLPSWRELKPQWKSCYYHQICIKKDFTKQFKPIPLWIFFSVTGTYEFSQRTKYPEQYFSPYISLKIYFLFFLHWNPSDYPVTKCLKISSGSQMKGSKMVLFLLPLFQSTSTLKCIRQCNSNMLYVPWNRRGVKWCWQWELLLRVPVLCQIVLEERHCREWYSHPQPHVHLCSHMRFSKHSSMYWQLVKDQHQKFPLSHFLASSSGWKKMFVIKLKCKTEVL